MVEQVTDEERAKRIEERERDRHLKRWEELKNAPSPPDIDERIREYERKRAAASAAAEAIANKPPARRKEKRATKRSKAAPSKPTRAELLIALQNATTEAAAVLAVARLVAAERRGVGDVRIPAPIDLAFWLPQCTDQTRGAAALLMMKLYPRGAWWLVDPQSFGTEIAVYVIADPNDSDAFSVSTGDGGGVFVARRTVEDVHATWLAVPEADRPRHPLAPLVAEWQQAAPASVSTERRADRRIMPTLTVVGPSPERERGTLFGGLLDDRPRTAPPPTLALFPELEPDRPRVPLLEIVDAAGVPLRSSGRGAPIEARLIVRGGLLMIRHEDRHLHTVRIAVTVGEMLDGLYPPKNGTRRIAENWPKIETALRSARDYTVPDATGGRWFPMALRRLPALDRNGKPALDDLIVLDLSPPPGTTAGATLDLPALDVMGVTSGPKWRAYIAARSLIWSPGKTRRPVPGAARWGWSSNPDDYPIVTLVDLRRLAFGADDAKHRTKSDIVSPWEDLPDAVAIPDQPAARTGIRGYRLLPAEATEALQRLKGAGGEPLRNRGATT